MATDVITSGHSKVRAWLAIILTIGGLAFLMAVVFWPVRDQQIALVATGYVTGVLTTVTGFYFGTSASSENKTNALINNQTNGEKK